MSYFEFRTNASYVQGPGILCELKKYSFHLGSRFLIVTGCNPIIDSVLAKVKKSFDNSMESNVNMANRRAWASISLAKAYDAMNKPVEYKIVDCDGQQVTPANIDKLTEEAKAFNADVIIGIGGGKVLDLVRGVTHKIGRKIEVCLCPTAVATNAPASVITVLYNEEGETTGSLFMPYHPALVLLDTEETIKSPAITLAAGMADVLGTYFEGYQTAIEAGIYDDMVASAVAANDAIKDTFYKYGVEAINSVKTGTQSLAYDSVVSQIAHTGGPQSLMVGVHYPHIIDDVLIKFPQCTYKLHGLLVGAGILPYLIWSKASEADLNQYIDFATAVGIPITWKELEITQEDIDAHLMEYCEITSKGPTVDLSVALGSKANTITGKDLYDSMIAAEEYINKYRGSK